MTCRTVRLKPSSAQSQMLSEPHSIVAQYGAMSQFCLLLFLEEIRRFRR